MPLLLVSGPGNTTTNADIAATRSNSPTRINHERHCFALYVAKTSNRFRLLGAAQSTWF